MPRDAPMSRQPRRQVDSPRKLRARPATTPMTTINSGHCRSDRAVALDSDRRGTGHQMFGAFHDIAQQHGARHGPDAAGYRRHPARDIPYAWIKITNQPSIGTGNADIDTDRAWFGHVRGQQPLPADRSHHDVSLSSVLGKIDGPGVTQRDRRVLTPARQQQSEWSANGGAASDHADLCPIEPDAVAAEQFDDAPRRTRHRTRLAEHQLAEVDRMKPVGIFVGIHE